MKKKLLFKLWQFPRLSETFLIAQMITAIKCGFEVKILVEDIPKNNLQHKNFIKEYNLLDKIIIEDYQIPKNKIKRILEAGLIILKNLPFLLKLTQYLKCQKKIELKYIFIFHFYKTFKDYDIIHVQYGTNGKPLDLLKEIDFFSSSIIVSFHGHDVYFPINGVIANEKYYEKLFKYSEKLIANTEYLKDVILKLGAPENKINVIPVGVDSNFFKPLTDKKHSKNIFNLITVGRLEIFKGQRLGLKVVKELKDRGFNVHYTIIGSGSQEKIVQQKIKEYGLTKETSFLGKKTQIEIKQILLKQDLFLMTSITDPAYGVESQGLVTAEAQACGLPVVAFDSGGVKYTIDDGITGFIVPEYDIKKMTNRIAQLINDRDQLQKMGREAVKYVEVNFSQNRIDEIWCETYNSVLK